MSKKFFYALNVLVLGLALLSCNQGDIPSYSEEPSTSIPLEDTSKLTPSGSYESSTTDGIIVETGNIENLEVNGTYEGAFLKWTMQENYDYRIYYKESEASTYNLLDSMLVRQIDQTSMRADLLGLKGREDYDIKVVPVYNNQELTKGESLTKITTISYDRSGYAHFNYTEGVGAYNDDGTLKDNAYVIYVTDDNKDDLIDDNPWLSEYLFNIPGNDWANKEARGIGWLLNNTQYSKAERNSSGTINVSKSSNTYSPDGANLGLIKPNQDHPIAIRFIGTVTSPEGLTAYNSVNEGGTVGDNGHMARMKDYKNITIEGVGDDAIIEGWGFHFIASNPSVGGYNFEARNLTLKNYPEDALGMEGSQEGNTITSPVRNCFVHHNTFLPGYSSNPAESDKAEGDGSCDFKRGYAFTMSYNYYEYCHKTNLVGSSDSSLQYDISFHHNIWYQCGSRMPLLRRANIHFYNNYILGDVTSGGVLSYVTSLRANAYMFAENNYYDGAKQVFIDNGSGGRAKALGNVYVSCFNNPTGVTEVVDRLAKVENNCAYLDKDYSNFDTNKDLFYFDENKGQSNCYLTDAVKAREECILNSGSSYRYLKNQTSLKTDTVSYNVKTPSKPINLDSVFNATFPTTKGDAEVDNILYTNLTSASNGIIKFKNQGVTFKVDTKVLVTINFTSANNYGYGEGFLVSQNGKVYLNGSGEVILEKGIYVLSSVRKDGETSLSQLKIEVVNQEELEKERLEVAKAAIDAIPVDISYNDQVRNLLLNANNAILMLTESQKKLVDIEKYNTSYTKYISLGTSYVENLITFIGKVDENSGEKINAALSAYDDLISFNASIVIANKDVLDAAILSYQNLAVDACIKFIDEIGEVTMQKEMLIQKALNAYNSLTDIQKKQITNYQVLISAKDRLEVLKQIEEVKLLYKNVDINDLKSLETLVDAYLELTELAKLEANLDLTDIYIKYTISLIDTIQDVTIDDKNVILKAQMIYELISEGRQVEVSNYSTLVSANEILAGLLNQSRECDFQTKAPSNDFFVVSKTSGNPGYKTGLNVTYNGNSYTTGLKIETGTKIEFTIASKMMLTLVTDSPSKRILINGQVYTADASGIVNVLVDAGINQITKSDSMNLVYLSLVPSN